MMIQGVASIFIILLLAFLLPGVINRTRAVLAGRKGYSLYQHISNVGLLMRKGAVYSPTTTLIFQVAPAVYLSSAFTAALLLPVGYFVPALSFKGDLVLFFYLLAAGRFALVLAALDTGSSFEGMGASREALYGALVEPALFAVAGTLSLITGRISFGQMFTGMDVSGVDMTIVGLLAVYALYKAVVAESGRIPVDDPRTHLELTMVHEVMVLDYCGFDLGVITMAGWIKTAALSVLAGNVVSAMFSGSVFVAVGATVLVAAAVGFTESFKARNRLSRNTTWIFMILAVALLLFFVAFMLVKHVSTI